MIDHKANGYVAAYRDAEDLAAGILFVLNDHDRLATAAAEKATRAWGEEQVASQYRALFESVIP